MLALHHRDLLVTIFNGTIKDGEVLYGFGRRTSNFADLVDQRAYVRGNWANRYEQFVHTLKDDCVTPNSNDLVIFEKRSEFLRNTN